MTDQDSGQTLDFKSRAYELVAEAMFKKLLDSRSRSLAAQVEYGKWLISSLFIMHGSAIAGLVFKSSVSAAPPYLSAIGWFVGGIVLALGAGFAAWWNFSRGVALFDQWANPSMLTNPAHWPQGPIDPWLGRTMWIAIGCGAASVGCLVLGSIHILCVWR